MGRGIAQVAAATGSHVTLLDNDEARAKAAHDGIASSLERAVARGKVGADERTRILAAIRPSTDLDGAAKDADVVVEAVPEKIEIKRALFARLGKTCPSHTLLGSNTSSLSIASIAQDCPAAERVIGLHFFNPVPAMALIEIVHGRQTAQASVDAAVAFALRLGKDPILVRDSPGFATSRLGVLLGLEAMRMVEEEVASAADIDKAMKLGYRHPMGPLELTDLVGLDVRLAIAEHLHRELGSETFRPPEILRRMVAEGRLGKKSGKGFYDHGT
ncbi:MAG: 3-hydroxyacyl-CoA dehydrogenase family protein [Planctomycetes bacterium]|nr:3-hydroxyacyl-CoA dehydrogenase family protein [Planctomycetota bacterium]MCB9916703.1 3-hydroxyacyl-CoA dehydrogenase family protein [Planctomycetota bacterium]